MGDPEQTTEAGGELAPRLTRAEPLLPLRVHSPESVGPLGRNPGTGPASVETAIVLELSVALLADPPTELTVIGVDNEQGIVTLTGEVGDPKVRRMAGEIASSHPGVASAINDLRIRSSRALPTPEPDGAGGKSGEKE